MTAGGVIEEERAEDVEVEMDGEEDDAKGFTTGLLLFMTETGMGMDKGTDDKEVVSGNGEDEGEGMEELMDGDAGADSGLMGC